MYFSYALQLAHGITRLPLTINIVLVAIAAPLMTLLAWRYGLKGGAGAVLLLYVLYLFIGTWLTHRVLLRPIGMIWLCRDVGTPLIVSTSVGTLGAFLIEHGNWPDFEKVGLGMTMLLSAWAISIAVAPRSTLVRLRRAFAAREVK
jgi:hypothetical protein